MQESNKTLIQIAAIIVVFVVLALSLVAIAFKTVDAKNKENMVAQSTYSGTISVSGTATVEVEPDIDSFSVSAEFTEATTSEAMEKASAMVNAAVDVLLANGDKQEDGHGGCNRQGAGLCRDRRCQDWKTCDNLDRILVCHPALPQRDVADDRLCRHGCRIGHSDRLSWRLD